VHLNEINIHYDHNELNNEINELIREMMTIEDKLDLHIGQERRAYLSKKDMKMISCGEIKRRSSRIYVKCLCLE